MEHHDRKNHVVDVTAAGMDVTLRKECLLEQRQLYTHSILPTYTIRSILGWPTVKPACCPHVIEITVISIDFCCII